MEELKLNELSAYLPYRVKAMNTFGDITEVIGIGIGNESANNLLWRFEKDGHHFSGYFYQCKPVLRPLSDIEGVIKTGTGVRVNCLKELSKIYLKETGAKVTDYHILKYLMKVKITNWDYFAVQKLLEWHFDVFGLIERGLALNMNEL